MNVNCIRNVIDEDFKKWDEIVKILAITVSNNNKRRLSGKHSVRRRQLMKFHK